MSDNAGDDACVVVIVSSRTDLCDNVVDVTSSSALDVVEIKCVVVMASVLAVFSSGHQAGRVSCQL